MCVCVCMSEAGGGGLIHLILIFQLKAGNSTFKAQKVGKPPVVPTPTDSGATLSVLSYTLPSTLPPLLPTRPALRGGSETSGRRQVLEPRSYCPCFKPRHADEPWLCQPRRSINNTPAIGRAARDLLTASYK